jgi:hypothetical protein
MLSDSPGTSKVGIPIEIHTKNGHIIPTDSSRHASKVTGAARENIRKILKDTNYSLECPKLGTGIRAFGTTFNGIKNEGSPYSRVFKDLLDYTKLPYNDTCAIDSKGILSAVWSGQQEAIRALANPKLGRDINRRFKKYTINGIKANVLLIANPITLRYPNPFVATPREGGEPVIFKFLRQELKVTDLRINRAYFRSAEDQWNFNRQLFSSISKRR